jgi:hypothetical protein
LRLRVDVIDPHKFNHRLALRVIGFEKSASIAFVVMEDHVVIEGVFYGGRSVEKALKPRK